MFIKLNMKIIINSILESIDLTKNMNLVNKSHVYNFHSSIREISKKMVFGNFVEKYQILISKSINLICGIFAT